MPLPGTIDLTILTNFVLSLAIVTISLGGFSRIGKPTPLYFGAAYALFSVSHVILHTGAQVPGPALILMRTGGSVLIAMGFFALLTDSIERQKVEAAKKESEQHLAATLAQTAVGIVEFLPDGTICRHNYKFEEIIRIRNLSSQSIWDTINPDNDFKTFSSFTSVMEGSCPEYSGEMLVTRRDRSQIWCQISLSAVKPREGRPEYFILVLNDISGLKQAEEELAVLNAGLEERIRERTIEIGRTNDQLVEEISRKILAEENLKTSLHEKEVLIQEIHHRVKNNLQIIASLHSLQKENVHDPILAGALTDSQTRVKSIALIHEKLYQSSNLSSVDFQAYLKNLVGNFMILYNVDKLTVRITISAKDLRLALNPAISLGLLLKELISNSLKYAFVNGKPITLVITDAIDEGTVNIRVRDDGVGIPEDLDWKNRKSLNLYLVQMLSRQLKGTVELSRNAGMEFSITFPAKGGGSI